MSKSRETPPQTASNNRDWPMGWALLLPTLGHLGWDLNEALFLGIVSP